MNYKYLYTPHSRHHWSGSMVWMISHDVKYVFRFKPLGNRRNFTFGNHAVQISKHSNIYLQNLETAFELWNSQYPTNFNEYLAKLTKRQLKFWATLTCSSIIGKNRHIGGYIIDAFDNIGFLETSQMSNLDTMSGKTNKRIKGLIV